MTASLSGLPIATQAFSSPSVNSSDTKGINPWIELSKSAYLHNAETISKMASDKPILAGIFLLKSAKNAQFINKYVSLRIGAIRYVFEKSFGHHKAKFGHD